MLIVQLFRETLSDKVHATTPKSIVGGFFGQLVELALYKLLLLLLLLLLRFEFTVFQRNLKEWQERPWTYVCEC